MNFIKNILYINSITNDLWKVARFKLTGQPTEIIYKEGATLKISSDGSKYLLKLSDKGRILLFLLPNRERALWAIEMLHTQLVTARQYGSLDFKDRQVVDIGANMGDTPIYFAVNGARKVFAYEPYPNLYEEALENISLNHLQMVIELKNEGVGVRNKIIKIPPAFVADASSSLMEFENGKEVRILTLEDIVKKNKIEDGVLKLDCEGGEYEILLPANDNVLRAFREIIVECHKGTEPIKQKLENAGFIVRRINIDEKVIAAIRMV